MPRGSAPGEHRGGRDKGTQNRRTIERNKILADERRAARADGFDSVEQMRIIAKYYLGVAAAEQRKTMPDRNRVEDCLEKAHAKLRDLAPYEHPKLSSLKVGGDPNAPLNLSGLSDSELAFFRRIMVKIGGEAASTS